MHHLEPTEQRTFAIEVLSTLRERGHVAYWAGGCVRDQLLGRTPKDYDVATDATPAEIRRLFGRRRTLEIGAAFGVVGVLAKNRSAGQVEVATFRRDSTYSDGRHPDSVTFSGPEEDAARRDFTINGLFYDPIAEQVIDFVGGQDDLRRRLIRAIGDAHERFAEDKLRMLRAVRFATAYDFALDPATAEAIRQMADQVTVVSPERIAQEMRGLLVLPRRSRGLELLWETGLVAALLPELLPMRGLPQHKPRQPGGDLWDHTLLVLDELREPTFTLALAALLHDAGKPRTLGHAGDRLSFHDHETVGAGLAGEVCRRWRLSRREEGRVCWLVKNHMYLGPARQMRWAKLQRMLTQHGIEELLALHEADARASTGDTSHVEYCRECLRRPAEELSPPPLVNGHDLIRHGVPPGPRFQQLLAQTYDAQLEKQIRTKREALALVDQWLAAGLEETGSDLDTSSPPAYDATPPGANDASPACDE